MIFYQYTIYSPNLYTFCKAIMSNVLVCFELIAREHKKVTADTALGKLRGTL